MLSLHIRAIFAYPRAEMGALLASTPGSFLGQGRTSSKACMSQGMLMSRGNYFTGTHLSWACVFCKLKFKDVSITIQLVTLNNLWLHVHRGPSSKPAIMAGVAN